MLEGFLNVFYFQSSHNGPLVLIRVCIHKPNIFTEICLSTGAITIKTSTFGFGVVLYIIQLTNLVFIWDILSPWDFDPNPNATLNEYNIKNIKNINKYKV